MSKAWKAHELRVARRLGTERIGLTGRDTPDAETDWLVVECKHRKALPLWLKDALAQAQKHAGPSQLPIAVLHEKGKHDSLVVMSFNDFCDWFVGEVEDDHSP